MNINELTQYYVGLSAMLDRGHSEKFINFKGEIRRTYAYIDDQKKENIERELRRVKGKIDQAHRCTTQQNSTTERSKKRHR